MGIGDLVSNSTVLRPLNAAGSAITGLVGETKSATSKAPSLEDLRCPQDFVQKISSCWKPGSFKIDTVTGKSDFHITLSYSRLTGRGTQLALLYMDSSFLDKPDDLSQVLRMLMVWKDHLIKRQERNVCIFSKSLDAASLYVRTWFEAWNRDKLATRFVPWRDIDGLDKLALDEEKRSWLKEMLGLTARIIPVKVELTQPEKARLINVLAGIPLFISASKRRILLQMIGLDAYAQGELVADSTPSDAATVWVVTLAAAGKIENQPVHALGALMMYLRDLGELPPKDKQFAESLIDNYNLVIEPEEEQERN